MLKTALKRIFGSEKRWTLANPPQEIIDLLGGGTTVAGELMSPSRAMELPAYLAAIRNISEDIAKVPLKVYRHVKPRGKKELPQNRLYKLLHDAPNEEMTSMSFREVMTQWALGWGNAYAAIERGVDGVAMALWPISPDRVTPRRAPLPDRFIYYVVIDDAGHEHIYFPDNLFHLHGMGWDGLQGYSVAGLARESLGLAAAQQTAGAAFFGNGSMPSGVAEYPGAFKDEEAYRLFRRRWQETYGGARNAFKLAILEHGMTYKPLSIPNKDAQWIESRKLSVIDAARLFRIPPHKLQDLERATFSNIEEQSIEYVTDTLMGWFVRWEQEIRFKLCRFRKTQNGQPVDDGTFAEHVIDGLLRGAPERRNMAYQIQRRNGVLSTNDWREKENMNPIGPEGDVYTVEANMIPLANLLNPPEPILPEDEEEPPEKEEPEEVEPEEPEEDSKTFPLPRFSEVRLTRFLNENQDLLLEALKRLLRLEIDKVHRHGDKPGWIESFYKEHVESVRGAFAVPVRSMMSSIWHLCRESEIPDEWHRVALRHVADMADRHICMSREQIARNGNGIKEWLNDGKGSRIGTFVADEINRLQILCMRMLIER